MKPIVRFYHPKTGTNSKCHMFDMDFDFFKSFRTGGVAIKSSVCTLPNGNKPKENSVMVCGTCGTNKFKRSEIITDIIQE